MPDLTRTAATVELEGKHIRIAPLRMQHVTQDYVDWLNEPAVNQHLESRYVEQTLESVAGYVEKALANPSVHFFAIENLASGRHIGNIKLECSQAVHRRGEISLFIGDQACWGRGIGTEAIALVATFAFDTLGLHKLTSGCYSVNPGSGRAFEKAGFHREAVLEKHYRCDNEWVDRWVYARFADHHNQEDDR